MSQHDQKHEDSEKLPPSKRYGDNSKTTTDDTDGERVKLRTKQKNQETETETDPDTEAIQNGNCPECDGDLIHDEIRGDTSCENCGLVVDEDHIDRGPEWRAFNPQEHNEKSRVGSPTTNMMHDKGLATNMDWRNQDGYGNSLSSHQRQKFKRLRKTNRRSKAKNSTERALRSALGEISRMASSLGLPKNVKETSSMLFRRVQDDGMLPGRSIEGMASATLYAAARMEKVPRTLDEIETASRVDRKRIARTYQYLNKELELQIGPADPEKYTSRFASKLDIDEHTEYLANHLIKKFTDKHPYHAKAPQGIAASAIYFSAVLNNEPPTQSEIADVTDVSEVTIRSGYIDMIDILDERDIFPDIENDE